MSCFTTNDNTDFTTTFFDDSTAFEQDDKGNYNAINYAETPHQSIIISSGTKQTSYHPTSIQYGYGVSSTTHGYANVIVKIYAKNASNPQNIYVPGAKIDYKNISGQTGSMILPRDIDAYKQLNQYLKCSSLGEYMATDTKADGQFIFVTFTNQKFEHSLRLKYSNRGNNAKIEIFNHLVKNK